MEVGSPYQKSANTQQYSQKPVILYIDDEDLNLVSFTALFEEYYTIHTAFEAKEAFKILETETIHVIVSDQRMPEMSGVDFFIAIARLYPHIIRILLTGYTDMDTIIKAINHGHIYSYVNKPFDFRNLKILLDRAIESHFLQLENKVLLESLKIKNQELSNSEERYKHITQSITDYIYHVFYNGKKVEKTVHSAACKIITGYEVEEFDSNQQLWPNIIHPDDRELYLEQLDDIIASRLQGTIEHRLVKKDGSIIWISNTIVLFKSRENEGIYSYNGVVKDITEKKRLQQLLFKTIIETEEKERRRLAGDLHDELGPHLATMRIYASSLKKRTQDPDQQAILDILVEIIKKSITNVREISNNLSPHLLENYGLIAALNAEIDNKRAFFGVTFEQNMNDVRMHRKLEIIVYRIVKELLNNTLKYAEATKVVLQLITEKNFVKLNYTDNGKGFSSKPDKKVKHDGLGLLNIQSRVNSVQGKCEINSSLGKGFHLSLKIPLEQYDLE